LESVTFMTSMSIYRNHAMSLLRNIASDEIEKESIRCKIIVISADLQPDPTSDQRSGRGYLGSAGDPRS